MHCRIWSRPNSRTSKYAPPPGASELLRRRRGRSRRGVGVDGVLGALAVSYTHLRAHETSAHL
eukprot:894428-Alexandrium_andersonii.AAC.1